MKIITLSKPFFNDEELISIKKVLESGWVAGQGLENKKLSKYITSYTKTKYAIPVSSCTAGLHLSLLAIGIKQGDSVLVSDFTFPASAHSVLYCGATPVFVDVDLKSYNIDASFLEKKINKKIKAIVVVHAFGNPADMDTILNVAKKYNLKIIEDAACALGAEYKGKPIGSFGDLAVFSFHARKNVTCGEGGIVVTNNKKYADVVNSLSSFGIESAMKRQSIFKIPQFKTLGYNYKLSDINAAIAVSQLKKYPKILKKRKKLVKIYNNLLANNNYLTVPVEEIDKFHVYQTYAVLLKKEINRNKLIIALKKDGIQSNIGTYACHIQPIYECKYKCLNSLYLFNKTLALPLFYEMEEKQIKYVVDRLNYHINKQIEK